MDQSLPGSSIHGILQARILEWVAIWFSRGSSQPRDQIQVSRIAQRFFTIWNTSSVQLLSPAWHFATSWTTAHQASLSITNSRSPPKPISIELICHSTISSSVVPFSSALNLSQHQGLFQWVSSSHQVSKVLEFQLQHQSFQWTPRTDLL